MGTTGASNHTNNLPLQGYDNIKFLIWQVVKEQIFGKGEFMNKIIVKSGNDREPMDFEKFKFICYFIAGMVAMVMGFIALYMIIYFAGR